MSVLPVPFCTVNLTEERSYNVQPQHYERLRDAMDKNEEGCIELELFEHPSGRCQFRLEDITDLMYCPQAWCDARVEQDRERRERAKLEGED